MPIINTLTAKVGEREIVADVRLDLERDVLVAIFRDPPIEVEAPDVARLRAAFNDAVNAILDAPPVPTPQPKRGRPAKLANTVAKTPDDLAPEALPHMTDDIIVGSIDGVLTSYRLVFRNVSVDELTSETIGAVPRSEAARVLWKRLLPGVDGILTPPRGWQARKRPAKPTALDEVVDTLIKKGLVKPKVDCPYFRARAAVVHAEDAAVEAATRYEAARKDGPSKRVRLRSLASDAKAARELLGRIAGGADDGSWPEDIALWWECLRDATRSGRPENRVDALAGIEGLRDRLVAAVIDLATLEATAHEAGEAVGNSAADAAKRAFVGRMLTVFHELVGSLKGEQPIHFVDAAAEDAGRRADGNGSWRATTKKNLDEPYFAALRTPLDRD